MGNKICPACKQEMSLIKWEFAGHSLYYWICDSCPQLINYQSFEASELAEVED